MSAATPNHPSKAATRAAEAEARRKRRADRDEKIIRLWAELKPAERIAALCNVSTSSVYRVTRDAAEAGDKRAYPRSEEEMSRARMEEYRDTIIKEYREGRSVDSIASMLALDAKEVRAAIYLALKGGDGTLGLTLGNKERRDV